MTQTHPDLRKELGGTAPAALSQLSADEQKKLLQSVRDAKKKQRTALTAAIDEGMSFVPALLRIPLKRILFP